MDSVSDFFATIGKIVVGAGIVSTFVWWLFRTFSEKWLNARFDERLAAYKHEQQKELEHLKFPINAQMDRATKLHEKEFEALPEAWGRLMDAYGIILRPSKGCRTTMNARSIRIYISYGYDVHSIVVPKSVHKSEHEVAVFLITTDECGTRVLWRRRERTACEDQTG